MAWDMRYRFCIRKAVWPNAAAPAAATNKPNTPAAAAVSNPNTLPVSDCLHADTLLKCC